MDTAKTTHVKTLILGGGITGLATACALQKHGQDDYLVLEAKPVPGGLCATTFAGGYHFDYSGHFLHLHTPQGKALIKKLLGSNLQTHTRHAYIYTNTLRVPFPFQTNLWALPPALRDVAVAEISRMTPPHTPPQHFEDWCLQSFGRTLYEAFFRPYNEKLWGCPLTRLTTHWCNPFVPAPARREMLQSARKKTTRPQGYNAQFWYPKTGGCGALIDALVARTKHVRLNAPVTRVNLTRKTVWVNRQKFTFENLVSTIPLPKLIDLLDGNTPLKRLAKLLQAQPVTVYHLAIARRVEPFSWIYCPDVAQPFYRVGLESAFAPDSVPDKNTSLFYIELPGLWPATAGTEREIWNGLYQKGLVNADDVKLFSAWQTIPYAYVIFDKKRAETVPVLLQTLEKAHCYCAGRYGLWEYSFMESSLLQALELAAKLA